MTLKDTIRTFIVDTFFVDLFGDGDSFLRGGILDSMGMLQLVHFLEENFGIKIDSPEMVPANLDSLNQVSAFVERKLAASR